MIRNLLLLWILVVLLFMCTMQMANAGECRNDETGEVRTFDGPCPQGWHPTGGWVE